MPLQMPMVTTAVSQPMPQVQVMQGQGNVPIWPAPGSDADMQLSVTPKDTVSSGRVSYAGDANDNISIVSKIGADLVVQNNINTGTRGGDAFTFSGGANMTQDYQAPQGFNMYENQAEMPLMHMEMMEDDGASVLAMARSGRVRAALPAGTIARSNGSIAMASWGSGSGSGSGSGAGTSGSGASGSGAFGNGGAAGSGGGAFGNGASGGNGAFGSSDMVVETDEDDAAATAMARVGGDQVKSWVVASGQTLQSVLQDWCNKEGWDLVWGTNREYPIEASAVFKGRFLDVASALVRNFSRANPVPYAKFYKGNRVVVISTMGE